MPLLSITREQGVIKRNIEDKDVNHNYIPDDLSNYKRIIKGQFGMNKMKAWQGSYGISDFNGIVSPAYYVFDLIGLESRFFHLAIRSKVFISYFGQSSDGVRIGQWDLSKSRMKEIPFIIPPKPEQTRIANFLDRKCEQIDKAIAQKERLIELLKERRQIIIQNAVTRGLDPNVKLKDSGVEWIGKIPEHWEVVKLKRLFTFFNNRRIPLSVDEREKRQGKYPYYGASGIIDYIDDYIFDENLIIIAEDGANLLYKSTPLAFVAKGKYWVNNHAHILKPNFSGFIFWSELLCSIDYATKISGAAQPKLSKERLANIFLPLPSKEELIKLSDYFADVDNKFKQAITYQQNQIEKLKEYKSVLIDSAVTGKIKVNE